MTAGGRWYLTLTTVSCSLLCWWDPRMTSYNLLMCRFYDSRRVLVSDPDYGPLLSSLLVGPST
jgi:hypothetical protein